ncbi:hypothetical protein ACIRPT_00225 [Streptomyces sp. NPDC101227]|uniref:hypothetical protein n=1 Tax=Streptomyces sp. NPDC101227 TaxID=3366136 RepID=UPI0038045596
MPDEGRLTDAPPARRFVPGDRVTPREATDHPEDPVGTVMTRVSTDELLVDFPLAGGEMYLDEELDLVEPAPPGWIPPPPAPA